VDRRNILFCMALFLLAAAATCPVLEMGVNDDWSYAHIAREFAATGHLAYNGWPVMPLVPQIVWAAVFIRLFGFSFLIVRLSTVVLGALCIPVLYCLGRESGLVPPFAAFATLLTALSPLTMPEAVTFMSDVPAFFLFALCFYGGVKCWKAAGAKDCARWAGLILVAGVLSGLDRQIYWLGPLLFLPAVAWVQRRRKSAMMWLAAAWLAAISAAAYSVRWFQAQPHALIEPSLNAWKRMGLRRLAGPSLSLAATMAATLALVLLPLLAGYVAPALKAASRKAALLTAVGALAGGFAASHLLHLDAPWMGNVLTAYGICPGNLLGTWREVLGPTVRDLLTMAVFLSCASSGLTLWNRRGAAGAQPWQDPSIPALVLGLVFSAAWLPILIYHSADAQPFDRYLMSFLPLFAIPLLRHYQARIGKSVSRVSWAMLALFALYGVAATHDAFARARAVLTAAQTLELRGIPRTEITAGFEYDGWTQLEAGGYVNHWDIANPPGAYRPPTCTGPPAVRLWFITFAPAIRARYVVAASRLPELDDAPAAPVDYTTWLPPGRRQVFTLMIPGGGYVQCR
jgi:4-amino-4-deoxy-L-arabinose transferase-like glycosyltransferase